MIHPVTHDSQRADDSSQTNRPEKSSTAGYLSICLRQLLASLIHSTMFCLLGGIISDEHACSLIGTVYSQK